MDVITITLLFVGLILFFGSFAEFIFKRFGIPDVLFLIILGFIIGPSALGYVSPTDLQIIAPIFTTFTLVFLLFDGSFNINLASLKKEFTDSIVLTGWNFFISTIVVTSIMLLFGFDWKLSLLAGFTLGGVSSSFVIPVLKQMNLSPKIFSLLTLESALTDVFSIVFSLAVIQFMQLGDFGLQSTFTQIVALFAVGAAMGIVAGVLWFILVVKVFKEHNYMLTIAYLLVIFVVTEFLQGSGAIAALFFGLVLNNSRKISSILRGITSTDAVKKEMAIKGDLGISITTRNEEFFYNQISFFLKTFFFVYIGILIDIRDTKILIIGILISVAVMLSRRSSIILKKIVGQEHKGIIDSMFARGLAAAAIAQIAVQSELPVAKELASIAYVVITGTIILASANIFIDRWRAPKTQKKEDIKKNPIQKRIEATNQAIKIKKQEITKKSKRKKSRASKKVIKKVNKKTSKTKR